MIAHVRTLGHLFIASLSVLIALRRFRSLAVTLVLVMSAGPAGAVCSHALAEVAGEAHEPMEAHGEAGHAPEHPRPPCHDKPETPTKESPVHDAPASHGDAHHCASACCASPSSVPDEVAPLPVVAGHVVPAPIEAVVDAPAEAPAPTPVAQPPPPTLRVHLALQRFLI